MFAKEKLLTEIFRKASRRLRSVYRAHRACEQSYQRAEQHPQTRDDDMLHIAFVDSVVNDGRHEHRNDRFHNDLENHKQGREHRFEHKALDM